MRAGLVRGVSGWPWVLLLAAGFAFFSLSTLPPRGAYPLLNAVDGTVVAALVMPLIAAASSMTAGRLRRAGVLGRRLHRRHALWQWVFAVLPASFAGAVVVCAGSQVQVLSGGAAALPAHQVLVPKVLVCVAVASLGALLGRILPLLVAMPAAVALGFTAFVLPNSMVDGPVRLMAGLPVRCCVPQVQMSMAAWVAHTLAATAVLLVSMAVWVLLDGAWVTAVAAVAVAVGLAVGSWSAAAAAPVHGLEVRSAQVACQPVEAAGRAADVCLWPENESSREHVADVVRQGLAVGERHQVPTPRRFTESLADLSQGDATLSVDHPDPMARRLMVVGSLTSREGCRGTADPFGDQVSSGERPSAAHAREPMGDVADRELARVWWSRQLGVAYDEEQGRELDAVPVGQQAPRVAAAMKALGCTS